MNPTITSTQEVQTHIQSVQITLAGIERFVKQFLPTKLQHWHVVSPFPVQSLSEHERMHFVLLLNAMSFSYWGEPRWTVQYEGRKYNGAQAMMAALGRAVKQDRSILNPIHWQGMSNTSLAHVLRGSSRIPLLQERAEHVREIGAVLTTRHKSDFNQFLRAQCISTVQLTERLIQEFPSFKDERSLAGMTIPFNKRAQLLIADLFYACPTLHSITDISELSACADYKLPQVLRQYGILQYSPALEKKITARTPLKPNSEQEIAIRAQTIHAVECIKKQLQHQYPSITANQINDYLWLQGQKTTPHHEPYHLTRTTAY